MSYSVRATDLAAAQAALDSDIDSFFLNGLISFSSSISSLRKNNFSWAFIQSYYSIFFFAKAYTGIKGYSIIYKDKTPLGIKLQTGEKFEKLSGNSHNVVFAQFKKHLHYDALLTSTIDNEHPLDWFRKGREAINYKTNPLPDPLPPISLFKYEKDLRKWLSIYLNDSEHTYTFDPSHCYVSYPIKLFSKMFDHYEQNNKTNILLTEEILNHLKENLADDTGPIAPFLIRLKKIS